MKHSNQWLQKRWSIWQIVYYYITQLKKTKQKEQNDTLTTQPHKKKSNKSSWSVRMLWSHNITEKAHQSCWSIFCICCWFCIFSRFTREHDLATSPTKGITVAYLDHEIIRVVEKQLIHLDSTFLYSCSHIIDFHFFQLLLHWLHALTLLDHKNY